MRRCPTAEDEGFLILREWLGLDREPLRFTPEQEARIRHEMEGLGRMMAEAAAVLRRELEARAEEGRR